MKIEQVRKLTPLEVSAYWITERESIRKKKNTNHNKPWTDDEILQDYRFCCPKRMDDKVSVWLMKNWYLPHGDHPNLPFAVVVARHFNQPHTLQAITDLIFPPGKLSPPKLDKLEAKIRAFKSENPELPIFNSAYIISGGTGNGARAKQGDKVAMLFASVLKGFLDRPLRVDTSSMRVTHERVFSYYGMGSFMAGQVVADLRYALPGGEWVDRDEWAPQGPGSTRGLCRVNKMEADPKGLDAQEFQQYFLKYMRQVKAMIPSTLSRRMEAMDYQNCLCETDKYLRALGGEGRPKQKYPGKFSQEELFARQKYKMK